MRLSREQTLLKVNISVLHVIQSGSGTGAMRRWE